MNMRETVQENPLLAIMRNVPLERTEDLHENHHDGSGFFGRRISLCGRYVEAFVMFLKCFLLFLGKVAKARGNRIILFPVFPYKSFPAQKFARENPTI